MPFRPYRCRPALQALPFSCRNHAACHTKALTNANGKRLPQHTERTDNLAEKKRETERNAADDKHTGTVFSATYPANNAQPWPKSAIKRRLRQCKTHCYAPQDGPSNNAKRAVSYCETTRFAWLDALCHCTPCHISRISRCKTMSYVCTLILPVFAAEGLFLCADAILGRQNHRCGRQKAAATFRFVKKQRLLFTASTKGRTACRLPIPDPQPAADKACSAIVFSTPCRLCCTPLPPRLRPVRRLRARNSPCRLRIRSTVCL